MSTEIGKIPRDYIQQHLQEFPQDTASNNTLNRFEYEGNWYVRKELLPNSKYFNRGSNNPEQLAHWMNMTYSILRKYFSDDETEIPETLYRVELGQYQEPTVVTLQEEVFGPTLRKADRHRLKIDPNDLLCSFEKKWKLAQQDPRWEEFPEDIRVFFQEMDINLDHIIYDRGRYYLVDW